MEQKQFKAESKRLLDLMIHSIYTHKEIFLRELISNASDAIDKLYFRSLTDDSVNMKKSDFAIEIIPDKENRTLTIKDNGIGMTKEELEEHLGTIANSGSLQFKSENQMEDDHQIIGQFGVGFYSAFMVADEVTIDTLLEKLKGYKLKVSKVCFQDFLFTEDIVGNFTVDLSSYGDAFSILQKYNDKISSMTIILYCDNSSIKLRITAKGRVTVYKSRSSMDDEEILFLHQILLNGGEH